jgi:hypothetical protein
VIYGYIRTEARTAVLVCDEKIVIPETRFYMASSADSKRKDLERERKLETKTNPTPCSTELSDAR